MSSARDVAWAGAWWDVHTGPHSLPVGTTRRDSAEGPFQRARVVLHEQTSCRPARETWSDAQTGEYQFHGVAPGVYYVVTVDPLRLKNGDVATDIGVPAP